jgi:hypothetical protein
MDYLFWVVRNDETTLPVDTGFHPDAIKSPAWPGVPRPAGHDPALMTRFAPQPGSAPGTAVRIV